MFCPKKSCKNHHNPKGNEWYRTSGTYTTKASGKVQRFTCLTCNKQFSEQTFKLDYWVHNKINMKEIHQLSSSCVGIRAMARKFKVTDKVILNRLNRLSHQSIGILATLRENQNVKEDLVSDGFESFVYSKFFPNNQHLLIGKKSQFFFSADYTPLRRKGVMTDQQKQVRAILELRYKPPKGALTASFTRICHNIMDIVEKSDVENKTIFTDEKREYVSPLKDTDTELFSNYEWTLVHKQVSSKAPRTKTNDLFSVNYYEREIRKDNANACRKTTRWSRNVNNQMNRLYTYGVYHNFYKKHRISPESEYTHGEIAGIPSKNLKSELRRFYTRRYFVSHINMNISEWKLWYRTYVTPLREGFEYIPGYTR